ncbi:dimethyl sulfoniopropionate demethylase [Kiloniella spongiae]|uniref:Dimethyl sulfoniopropionate demethylase n=1 Tax=Kiloniella spongiae TaxID=1489064 RepID=A0A0H2M965_9PROT|nr:dimethylsulfoniopropionate demethylase [Kiloniella spongiae]KLN59044.1 dimethyl sulfoniopropionate demethylase [Kiloniella spongiae]
MTDGLNMSRRIRRTPYTDRVEQVGVRGFSVVNHMLLPKAFQSTIEEDYWHLREHVQVWDVSCQRQVQITGLDAERLVQSMTPRSIAKAKVGDCYYIPIVDQQGGMINDPVMLKIADDQFWLSIADSDVLLYAMGLAIGANLDVEIAEPDVSPLAVQGPKAEDLMVSVFGEGIRDVGFFKYARFEFKGTQQVIARSGYSRQGGFEIYLDDGLLGHDLWDTIWEAGQTFNITPGCPNLIERIEGGLFSYGNEMTRENNPLELGLEKFCTLDGSIDFIGQRALQVIDAKGVDRSIRGLQFDGPRAPTCSVPWPVTVGGHQVGQITSCIWSPRLETNVGLSFIDRGYWDIGQNIQIEMPDNQICRGEIVALPML